MGVLLVDADDVRRQQLGTVLSFMGIPWQEVVESDLDVAIETAGPLQGILAGELRERALSELLAAHPRLPFLSLMPASHGCSNFIGVAEAPFTYESLTRHLHFCQACIPVIRPTTRVRPCCACWWARGGASRRCAVLSARWPRPTPTY